MKQVSESTNSDYLVEYSGIHHEYIDLVQQLRIEQIEHESQLNERSKS
jgi:hypothetical protein